MALICLINETLNLNIKVMIMEFWTESSGLRPFNSGIGLCWNLYAFCDMTWFSPSSKYDVDASHLMCQSCFVGPFQLLLSTTVLILLYHWWELCGALHINATLDDINCLLVPTRQKSISGNSAIILLLSTVIFLFSQPIVILYLLANLQKHL